MKKYFYKFFIALLALSFFIIGWLSHSAYAPMTKNESSELLYEIKKSKELNVVLLNSPSTYYIGVNGPQGFEYDLLKAYADHLGVTLNITTAHTVKEAIELSKGEDVHITSASITKTLKRENIFHFGPSYFEVQEQVVCNRSMQKGSKFPRDIEDLEGLTLMVGEDTSYQETILMLKEDGYDINATFTSEYSTEELLDKVSRHEIDCTIADSNIYSINLRYFPEIALAFSISPREQLAWILRDDAKALKADMYAWLNDFNSKGKLAELKDHYYSYVLFFDYYNTKTFYTRIQTRLPKYQKYFEDSAKRFGIPWTLLASISYQESHWNPNARSFTGVRGLMMLTQNTADHLGVKDRVDPEQSIVGGARHIKQLLEFIPVEVEGENRLKFALAAYNIGLGHIKDAQLLAKHIGLNHNTWNDLKRVLPLLSQKKYYKDLKYGYARGEEPVRYVEAIYDYKDILEKKDVLSQEPKE
jgi:membrane-bound lytic murein transglycosylase F